MVSTGTPGTRGSQPLRRPATLSRLMKDNNLNSGLVRFLLEVSEEDQGEILRVLTDAKVYGNGFLRFDWPGRRYSRLDPTEIRLVVAKSKTEQMEERP